MLSWDCRYHGALHFFGHIHSGPGSKTLDVINGLPIQPLSMDVGIDNNELKPFLFEDVVKRLTENG
jgi:calcineurin-like phosphoesterase family protein